MRELISVKEIEAKNIMTKSSLPTGGYSANPYVGCPHKCKYCYASFMKKFTGHMETWGTFLDVKVWQPIKNPSKYVGQSVIIGSVTDGYNPMEETFCRTRVLLEQLKDSGAKITICTKSDLVLRDLDLLTKIPDVTVSWSINTLDENFKNDMDRAVSIERRLIAMKKFYDMGIRTACFISPIFPEITNVPAIIERVKNQCDFVWLENLNLRGDYKEVILEYIENKYPQFINIYNEIYRKGNREYWKLLEMKIKSYVQEQGYPYFDNFLPNVRSEIGKPMIVNYFYHEEIKGSGNTGTRKERC